MSDDVKTLGWSVLELMGHRKVAGFVTEVDVAGKGLLRVDVPASDGVDASTHFFSPEALYCLTPTTEHMVRLVARSVRPEPVSRWELPAGKPRGQLEAEPHLKTPDDEMSCGEDDDDDEHDEGGDGF